MHMQNQRQLKFAIDMERDELKVVNGYLFNHESEFRGNDFVTARIINQM